MRLGFAGPACYGSFRSVSYDINGGIERLAWAGLLVIKNRPNRPAGKGQVGTLELTR